MPVRHQLLTLDRHPKGSPASRTPTRCASPHWARAPLQSRPHRRGRAHSLTAVAPTGGLFSYIRAHTVSRSRSHTRLSHPPPSMYLLIALSPTLSSPALSHAGRHSQFTAHISRLALRKAHIHSQPWLTFSTAHFWRDNPHHCDAHAMSLSSLVRSRSPRQCGAS